MGQSHSNSAGPRQVSIEQLSHELALHFASKCYTHLEIAHFKDNFKALADHQDDIEYWKEDTLSRFLNLPDTLGASPLLYQMCTYIGAFPFPSLAPCILTREAMLKIVTIMTGRYKQVLKRGQQDKVKLLFRSLAVFDRRASTMFTSEKPDMAKLVAEQRPDEESFEKETKISYAAGFAIDEPANDDEEEDDDDLMLAALDTLDAIEVFKKDQRMDRKIQHAQIPSDNFKRLIMLLLAMAPLEAQHNLAEYGKPLSNSSLVALENTADSILEAFNPNSVSKGISYTSFVKAASFSVPYLFDPLSALFEHLLFSQKIAPAVVTNLQRSSMIVGTHEPDSSILNDASASHLSTFLSIRAEASSGANNLHSSARFHPLYSTTSHGTSLTSFSRQVMSWSAGTLLLVNGSLSKSTRAITIGAYLPEQWTESTNSSRSIDPSAAQAMMFQLSPRHAIFPGNPYNKTTPLSHFSSKTGIALGCVIPPPSRANAVTNTPILGPVSLLIDSDISTAIFQHDGDAGTGAFVTDPGLEKAQLREHGHDVRSQAKRINFNIDALEIWGVTIVDDSSEDEVARQKKRLAWDEAEAARRRGVNFGGDKDGARALLEMAGIVGQDAHNRSGGSV